MNAPDADRIYAEMHRITQQAKHDYEDVIYLTQEQIDSIRLADEARTRPFGYQLWHQPVSPLLGTPIKLVDKVEDSTPWKKGWRPWPNLAS